MYKNIDIVLSKCRNIQKRRSNVVMSSAHSRRVGKPSSSVGSGPVRLSNDDNSGVQFQIIHSLGESPRAFIAATRRRRRRRWRMDVVRQDGRRRIRRDQVGEGGHWRWRRERRHDRRLYRRRRRRRLFLGIVRGSENATTGFGVFRFALSQSLALGFRIARIVRRRKTVGG